MAVNNNISVAAKFIETEHCQKVCKKIQNNGNEDDEFIEKTFTNAEISG